MSGAIHHAAVVIVTGSLTVLFVPWFAALGLSVVFTSWVGPDYPSRAWVVRAGMNVVLVATGLGLTLLMKRIFGIP